MSDVIHRIFDWHYRLQLRVLQLELNLEVTDWKSQVELKPQVTFLTTMLLYRGSTPNQLWVVNHVRTDKAKYSPESFMKLPGGCEDIPQKSWNGRGIYCIFSPFLHNNICN